MPRRLKLSPLQRGIMVTLEEAGRRGVQRRFTLMILGINVGMASQ
jgi:hypothetical protein